MTNIRLLTAQYLLSGVAALVVGWPFIHERSILLSILMFFALTVWIASFLHLAEAPPRKILAWTIGASVLSFVAPFLVAWLADAPLYNSMSSAGIIWVLGSVAALAIAKRVRETSERSPPEVG